jgi:hypothetical protein
MLRFWRGRKSRKSTGSSPASNRYRPQLQVLEDRLAPAIFTVTTTADILSTDGVVRSLRDALTAVNHSHDVNNTIVLGAGTYQIQIPNSAGNETANLSGDFNIAPANGGPLNLTIVGQGPENTIIDANGLDRAFEIQGTNAGVHVTFADLTITHGATTGAGGAVLLDDSGLTPGSNSVTFADVVLSNNLAQGALGHGAGGGAVASDTGDIILIGSVVRNNLAAASGGGVATDAGDITLIGSAVRDNTAGSDGGGLYSGGANPQAAISLHASRVDHNTASGDGGGLFDADVQGTLALHHSSIQDNLAGGAGGGLHVQDASVTIDDSVLNNNTASGDGGALDLTSTHGTLQVSGSIFDGNQAGQDGGAVANQGAASVTVLGSRFANNSATGSGGAWFDDAATDWEAHHTNFHNNRAGANGGGLDLTAAGASVTLQHVHIRHNTAGGAGGGLRVDIHNDQNDSSLVLDDALISDNTADSGGGLASSADDLNISNALFVDNRSRSGAGGGLLALGQQIHIQGSIISGNIAGLAGGGAALNAEEIHLVNTDFNNDAAGSAGGGLFFSGGSLDLVHGHFLGDRAGQNGGGLFVDGTSVSLSNCIVQDDTAGGSGGGLFATASTGALIVDHSNLSGNRAGSQGGGLATSAQSNALLFSELDNNAASQGGGLAFSGGMNSNGPTLALQNSTLAFNRAADQGGGLFANTTSGTLEVVNATLAGNRAGNLGGGAAIAGSTAASFLFVTIDSNSAGAGGGLANTSSSAVQLGNSLVALNSAAQPANGPDLSGNFTDLVLGNNDLIGHNLIGSTTGFTGLTNGHNGDLLGVSNPGLNPLANNGGPTQTQSLKPGSPALDAANFDTTVQSVTTIDQRGIVRPRPAGTNGDIGAFESDLG